MSGFAVVLAKECRDNIRDRRTIISSFSLAIFGPLLFVGLIALVLNTTIGESREGFSLTVTGAANAPGLMAYLGTQNVQLTETDLDDPKQAVIEGTHPLVLVIDDDYPERFTSGQMASVALVYDSSSTGKARRNVSIARQIIAGYGQQIGLLRLQLRGIDPAITQPIRVHETDTASSAARALSILAILPYLLVLLIFMGGFYLAIDATAGEREHGSLEPLLTLPITRNQLVLGKLAAATIFSAVSLVLFLVSLRVSVPFVPLQQIGMSLDISIVACLQIFAVSIPLMVFGAALLTVAASFAKSYKEAQTYLTMVILLPTLPLVVTQLMNVEPSNALMLVPSLSQASLIADIIKGDPLSITRIGLSVFGTGAAAALLCALAVQLYRRERILV